MPSYLQLFARRDKLHTYIQTQMRHVCNDAQLKRNLTPKNNKKNPKYLLFFLLNFILFYYLVYQILNIRYI